MTTRLVYLDTETTGLDPTRHEVWEIAWAVDDQPIKQAFVPHSTVSADPTALAMNGYHDRCEDARVSRFMEDALYADLEGATVVGANPAFDTAFLSARWGEAPWHYRLIDVETFAMGALCLDRPIGLASIRQRLVDEFGVVIPEPDHTAAGDVATLRACYLTLRRLYAGEFKAAS